MEPTLFSFIWKHSKRQQLMLLALTLVTFPFIYATLELPKRIINDAIGMQSDSFVFWSVELSQIEYLMALCFAFLAAVLAAGLLKMRLNTLKGILGERMLRRLRYTLIARMMRFPAPYFRTTSQGELVSMITSEAEPMGGLMGDAVAQPVFQAGQMLTIVAFLFMQSVWFGLASIALIPLQAWLIPMLQRQINKLNKDRIQEVRKLASEIGETAAGIEDLRINGGWRYRLALVSDRLGKLFEIRFRIYRKKFFMKFLNNLISQMTPFLFYSVGGYLAIKGEITVGALVAALAAYKDLSAPWKELLFFYNHVQDMSLRWKVVTERFAPAGIIKEELFEGTPASLPRLTGEIEFKDVTVKDADGHTVLEDISLKIPAGARIAIKSSVAAERAAFAQLLTRELVPTRGQVLVAGRDILELHQAVIAARVGYAHSRPYIFDGTLGDNLLMSLRSQPQQLQTEDRGLIRKLSEAKRAGNSADLLQAEWVNPEFAGMSGHEDIRDWWFKLAEAMGIDEQLFRRTLQTKIGADLHPYLTRDLVKLRSLTRQRLFEAGLDDIVHHFEPEKFNPAVPLGGNLLFATPRHDITQEGLAGEEAFIRMISDLGLGRETLSISIGVMGMLKQTFGRDNTDHPLFRRLGMDDAMYRRLYDISERFSEGLNKEDEALLMTVPFLLTAEQIGPGFSDKYKDKILSIRKTSLARMRAEAREMFEPVSPEKYLPVLTVLENVLYGRISIKAGAKTQLVEDLVAEILVENGLRKRLASLLYDMPTGLGGANLPAVFKERAAFSRAGIKRPDILLMDTVLASHDSDNRLQTRERLRELLPAATMIFMEDRFEHPERYDLFVEIRDGRIDGVKREDLGAADFDAGSDFSRKVSIIANTELFSGLDARNQRLLAFSALWHKVEAGQRIFCREEMADAVYLCISGEAELRWPGSDPDAPPISLVEPGRVIGDLSVITGGVRQMDLIATKDSSFLRIGTEEFRAVIENDAGVAMSLLETVSGHLQEIAAVLRKADIDYNALAEAEKELSALSEDTRMHA